MTEDKKKSRGILRAFFIVVGVMFFVPVTMLFGLWMTRVAIVEEHALSPRDVVVRIPAISESVSTASDDIGSFGPVTETTIRDETYRVNVPVVDPQTGRTSIRTESRVRQVPVATTRQVANFHGTTHDPQVMQAVGELRNMKEDDENREQKMNELRQHLELEFSKMHEKQAEEIAETSKRLDALKELHEQRGENKDKIVERRVNDLLGMADEFGWLTNVPTNVNANVTNGTPLNQRGPPHLPGTNLFQQVPGINPQQQFSIPAPARKLRGAAPGYPQATPKRPASPPMHQAQEFSNQPSNFNDQTTSPRFQKTTEAQRSPPSGSTTSSGSATLSDATTLDEPPTLRESKRTIVVASSGIGELFQLARAAAAANSDLKSAEVEYADSKVLQSNRVITASTLRQSELKLEKAKREVELNQMQLSALKDSMTRARELAAAERKHASARMRAAQSSTSTFAGDREEIAFEIEKAANAMEEAEANLSQLAKVLELVEGGGTKTETEEPTDDGGR